MSEWTPEKIRILSDLAKAGQSASEIGRAIGETRNAVIGWSWRHGIKLRGSQSRGNIRSWADPTVHARRVAAMRVASADPVVRARIKASWDDPIVRYWRIAGIKAAWAKKKKGGR